MPQASRIDVQPYFARCSSGGYDDLDERMHVRVRFSR
jgi:hypothetical protein